MWDAVFTSEFRRYRNLQFAISHLDNTHIDVPQSPRYAKKMFDPLPFDLKLDTLWLGHPLYFLREVGSTNHLLRNLAPGGTTPGTVLLTDYQSAGRGRRGRTWDSAPGTSLLFSFLLPPFPNDKVSLLPIVTSVGVARTYEAHLGLSPTIKWPNDILLDRRKVGGILLESEWASDGTVRVIAGIGLNVNQNADTFEDLPTATSIRAVTGQEVPRGPLLAALLHHLEAVYNAYILGWLPHEEWSQRADMLRQKLWVYTTDTTPWSATAIALGKDGELIVEDDNRSTINLHAGDVSVRYAE